jgi:predicted ATPase/class 3 adenylate cyclase
MCPEPALPRSKVRTEPIAGPKRPELPSGTVTFLFTDIEGSTRLLDEFGAEEYAQALLEHRRIVRQAFGRHGGVEVDTQGDALFIAFPAADQALHSAREAQEALAGGPIRVRMGLHTGTPLVTQEGYVGPDVHKAARIAAAGHGGQVLLSGETRERVGLPLTDLGEHRLKDFERPVPIFQLGSERFPPLRTISNTNLPRPVSSFIGRNREVEEVVALLRDGIRLLTLTGPGGSGKTRLAIEAAAELVPEFKAGVFWVGLAPLRDPALVSETIASTLGVKEGLAKYIGNRDLLLLLDNLEQVVAVAPELAALVEACPNLRLLCTSRELLRVRGEVEFPVAPLGDPDAVELFCARSKLKAHETIGELCQRLDNLPLAIELAAARTNVLSPRQIFERLSGRLDLLKGGRDADPRQQTLRATIEWSYDLLRPDEGRLFARLAVFQGGCTLEAAEEIAAADVDTLESLVEKSLLRHADGRFRMLMIIREYAVERLAESAEANELWRRHAEHFLALAEEAEPHLRGSPGKWLERLDVEHDNLRAALDRLEASGETQLVLRLTGALQRFWYLRGHLAEGRRWLESALTADGRPTAARANALNGAALMALDSGDTRTMKLRAEEALALHLELGDVWGAAVARFLLGHALMHHSGDLWLAQQLFEESLRSFRALADEHYALLATHGLAVAHYLLDELDVARDLHEQELRAARALDNQRMVARALAQLAVVAVDQRRVDDAFSMLEEAARIDREVGEMVELAVDLSRFARALAAIDQAPAAAILLASSETLRAEIGATFLPWAVTMNEKTVAAIRSQVDEAAFAEAWEQGRALTVDRAVAMAVDAGSTERKTAP